MVKSVRLHAIVHGRVQGVYFRDSTRHTANRLGLTGWVRNLSDGAVEVTAEGSRPALDSLLAFLRVGPPDARVDAVDADWPPADGEFAAFSIRL